MKSPILITGCARSGTSLVAGVINTCGAFGGKMSGPNSNNAKGMFENVKIRNDVVKPFFRTLDVDPMGQFPLPDIDTMNIPENWENTIQRIMMEEEYPGGPWMYKGAKMCLHWKVWGDAFPNAKWIIVRRKTPDIIRSCERTNFMRAFDSRTTQMAVGVKNAYDGWLWWVHQHEERFREMMNAGLNIKVVWPERMVEGDYTQIQEAVEWVGLEWNQTEVLKFIEPKLWKTRQKL
jgi:hypothetical protein